jgi:hypothetical protein
MACGDDGVMDVAESILEIRRPTFWARFQQMKYRPLPLLTRYPRTIEEALTMGYQMGLQEGYGEGLVEGTELGMDIGSALAFAGTTSWISRSDLD